MIRPWKRPLYPHGHLAILRGNLATEGSVTKITGVKPPAMTGPARVFESEESCLAVILDGGMRAGDVIVIRYEGPKGGPGMREMLAPTSAIIGAGLGDLVGLITDGGFREALRNGGGARRPGGRSRRNHRAGAGGRPHHIDADRRLLQLDISEAELLRRRAAWKPPEPRYTAGVLYKYSKLVSSASLGAVTDL